MLRFNVVVCKGVLNC